MQFLLDQIASLLCHVDRTIVPRQAFVTSAVPKCTFLSPYMTTPLRDPSVLPELDTKSCWRPTARGTHSEGPALPQPAAIAVDRELVDSDMPGK